MHNLITKITKFRELLTDAYGPDNLKDGNFRAYPNPPKASDIEIVALSLTAESLNIDSETSLYNILEIDHPEYRKEIPDRSNFNRRRRRLQPFIDILSEKISLEMIADQNTFIIDSMPLPICRFVRCSRLKIMREDLNFLPTKGYLPIDKTHFFGYKLNLVVAANSVIRTFSITQANVHDVRTLKDMTEGFIANSDLLGDKGYLAKDVQLNLFEQFAVKVITPLRNNQTGPSQWNPKHRRIRKRIETTFSQFCDQFLIKRNFAKSFNGFFTRITSKIAAYACLQYFNHLNDKPLNRIKNSLNF